MVSIFLGAGKRRGNPPGLAGGFTLANPYLEYFPPFLNSGKGARGIGL
jgi:hypothetical protein